MSFLPSDTKTQSSAVQVNRAQVDLCSEQQATREGDQLIMILIGSSAALSCGAQCDLDTEK